MVPSIQPDLHRFATRPPFAVRHTISSGCRFELHAHMAYTVTTVLDGHMDMIVGDNLASLEAGESGFTNVGQPHSAQSEAVEFVSVGLDPGSVNELVDDLELARTTLEIVFSHSSAADEVIAGLARAMVRELGGDGLGRDEMLDALGRQLTIHLLREHLTVRRSARVELSRVGPVDRRIRFAVEFIHDHFDRDLSLEEIAASAFLSEYHFARLFRDLTGMTPGAYLTSVRLQRARELLADTDQPITRIAGLVGYQSQSHFTHLFKATTGLTPRDYRRAIAAP